MVDEEARELARKLHAGQVNLGGHPYIEHVERAWMAVMNESEDVQIAALLHDTVEDGLLDLVQIEMRFGSEAAMLVDFLTHREGETYRQYIESVRESPDAIKLKVADIRDNMDETRLPPGLRAGHKKLMRQRYEPALERLLK